MSSRGKDRRHVVAQRVCSYSEGGRPPGERSKTFSLSDTVGREIHQELPLEFQMKYQIKSHAPTLSGKMRRIWDAPTVDTDQTLPVGRGIASVVGPMYVFMIRSNRLFYKLQH